MPHKDPERRQQYHAEYRRRQTASGYWKRYYADHRDDRKAAVMANRMLREYGLTYEDYDRLHDAQQGLCAICGRPEEDVYPSGVKKRLSVDHDHETGVIRDLLCRRCNVALGDFRDDPAIVRSALDYLERHAQN